MVRTATWADRNCGIEVLSIGRQVGAIEDCVLEAVGSQLGYRISLRGGRVWFSAGGLDEGDPQALFSVGDTPENWASVRQFLRALEHLASVRSGSAQFA